MKRKRKQAQESETPLQQSEVDGSHQNKSSIPAIAEKVPIKQWSEDDRPREKLERLGPQALSDAELLAILVGSGSAKQSAVDLMRDILKDSNYNLNTLGRRTIADLTRYNGMGPAKAITILAACELSRRYRDTSPEQRPSLLSPGDIYDYLARKTGMTHLDVEEFWVLLLKQNCQVIKAVRISHGGLTETAVDLRVIIREAVLANAPVIAIAHNHPSGNTRPSHQDDEITERIRQACKIMRICLLDHLIVVDGDYYSYKDNGKL